MNSNSLSLWPKEYSSGNNERLERGGGCIKPNIHLKILIILERHQHVLGRMQIHDVLTGMKDV